jgi:amino acid adenylation domain-containing protein
LADAGRLAALSPAKRLLLAQRLKEKAAVRLAVERRAADGASGLGDAASVGDAAQVGDAAVVGGSGGAGASGGAGRGGAIPRVPRGGPLPASAGQRQIWLLEQLAPGGAAYHIEAAWSLSGHLDPAALADVLAALAARHEALRTRLVARDGEPLQEIVPRIALPLPLVDLSRLAAPGREAAALAAAAARRPFDLARAPLLRALLVRRAPAEHLLLLILHHAAADGWSMGILFREMAALYAARTTGRPARLPALPVQYADFAADQDLRLASGRASLLAAWRRRLLPETPRLDLPADRPRPLRPGGRGGVRQREIPAALAAALDALARQEEATPFMVLAAGLAALLGRLAGQEEVNVGTPVAGRDRPEIEGVVGYFVNTLVLRLDLSGQPTFRALLGRVRERAVEAWQGAELPFEELVSALRPQRRGTEPPFFQVLLALQNAAGDLPAAALPGLRIAPAPLPDERGAKLDLSLSIAPAEGGGLTAVAVYRRDLFDAPTIDRLLRHFEALLAAAAAAPDGPLSALPLLSPAERHQLLREWNDTAAPLPDVRVHELFAACAAADGAAPAVVQGGRTLASYHDLDRLSLAIAARLARAGVGPDVPVALLARPSVRAVAAVLAILRAGGAVLPLDPDHPQALLAYLLADSRAPVVLTESALRPLLPSAAPFTLSLDEAPAALSLDEEPSPQEPAAAGARPLPGQAAYLIYTSGSTGRPKGTVVPHSALAAYLLWVRDGSPFAGRRLPLTASLAFDASFKQLLGPLVAGDAVWLPRHGTATPHELLAEIAAEPRSALNCVPSLWRALLEVVERGAAAGPAALLLGGEGFEPALVTRTRAALPAVEVWNLYGPTEATANAAAARLLDGGEGVGRPIANVRVHLLDRTFGLLPPGAAGELAIGGAGLARGYLGRPDLTAERFVPDPFARRPGERLYLTGDRARRRPDGRLEVRGREDGQVKVRGVRIELAEVEAVIAGCAGVAACAVVAERRDEGVRLVAWVVLRGEAAVEAVRRAAAGQLPAPALPAVFAALPELPRTATGKLDRRALSNLDPGRGAEAPYVAPRTAVEERLAALWRDVLGVERVGVHDSFFALGGDSIQSVRIAARARQAGLPVGARDLLERPTVAALAAGLPAAPQVPAAAAPALVPAQPLDYNPLGPHGPHGPHGPAVSERDLAALLSQLEGVGSDRG